jgi:hypothetical protein
MIGFVPIDLPVAISRNLKEKQCMRAWLRVQRVSEDICRNRNMPLHIAARYSLTDFLVEQGGMIC